MIKKKHLDLKQFDYNDIKFMFSKKLSSRISFYLFQEKDQQIN